MLQAGFQRQARSFDHTIGDHNERSVLVEGEHLLRAGSLGRYPQHRTARQLADS
ncbi:hypothetical protein OG285_35960 (plasmid) [Streptomyces sp. NBC_01471]